MDWIIDGKINLTRIAADAKYHRLTIIDALVGAGLARRDGEQFADYIIAEAAGATDGETPDDMISDEGHRRLSLSR